MDFGGKKSQLEKLKRTIYPTNKAEREKRLRQYRDIGIFVASIVLVGLFEKKIVKLLSVDKSDLA